MRKAKIWDIVNNNHRADRQHVDWKDKEEEKRFNDDRMLYDEKSSTNKRIDLVVRMVKAFNKNREKIEGGKKQRPLKPNEKRMRKIYDLLSRSGTHSNGTGGSDISWKNLQ